MPTTVAARAPRSPARIAGRPLSQARSRSRRDDGEDATIAATSGRKTKQDRAAEAVGRELQAALGDVGEVAEAAGVEDRAGEVGVGAGDEVDEREQRQDRERSGDATRAPRGAAAPATATAATAAPTGNTIAAPTSAPKRPAAKTKAANRPTARNAAARAARREPRGEARQPRPGSGDDQHREQRLELVADPVEADAQAGVRPEQRERGQRRAGDDVDRVGETVSAEATPSAR